MLVGNHHITRTDAEALATKYVKTFIFRLLPSSCTSIKLVKSVSMDMTYMMKSRFSDEQIIGFLMQAEAGMPFKELCSIGGFNDATF